MIINGRIIEEQKTFYRISTDKGIIQSTLKGVLKKKKNRLFVGDLVTVEIFNVDRPEGIIRELLPRKNSLNKPAVTNIDQVILLNTYKHPRMDIEFINRFLFLSSFLGFPTILCFNKFDLLSSRERNDLYDVVSTYEKIGYRCCTMSALTGENIDDVLTHCKNKLSIFAGPSGTGKSTILSKLFPHKSFKINELSKNIQRGTHTTTHTTLLKLDNDGYIADTPGFSFVNLPVVPEDTVIDYFPDIQTKQGTCRFTNCVHDNEPGCAIKENVVMGHIDKNRYVCYLKIYHSMREKRRRYSNREYPASYK